MSSSCILEDLEPSGIHPSKGDLSSNIKDAALQGSTSSASLTEFCKICHCGSESCSPLITPCNCDGSLKYVHQECLQRWIKSSNITRCELCKYLFVIQTKTKPLHEWEKLEMSNLEQRKLCCNVTFHIVAVSCVVWSLYVLIARTNEEITEGSYEWPFWIKIIIVIIGFIGTASFMYIQCKVYVFYIRKWKAYNRVIFVVEAREEITSKSISKLEEGSCNDSGNINKANVETQTSHSELTHVSNSEEIQKDYERIVGSNTLTS